MARFVIRCYTPKVLELGNELSSARAKRMVDAIHEAGAANVDIFVGPEYFFTYNSDKLLHGTASIAYSADDADLARSLIATASARWPKMLIIPGTFFMIQGVSNPRIFNTAFVYLGGQKLSECSKFDSAADQNYAERSGLDFFPGETGRAIPFKGKSFYLQICSDATNPPPAPCDMSIVTSFCPGAAAATNLAKFGGRRVIADGEGKSSMASGYEQKTVLRVPRWEHNLKTVADYQIDL
ncbi:hypothetical protein POL68_10470 [Stigmatella sp. ncwal1]|uniref:CN hydrolase domain-containing protein n=1 Tax=Stigmatella ashevillensis TaxID=2995309 RepID=A0ABT5D720_9BACT|nr:hypothetical protein [Stigmatella ashevillena]MDC0708890.1 hypothetical protein [Stigmatella ashevillena]